MKNIQLLYSILSSHERKIAGLLLIMILIMAILDMIGVASILPFIAVLSNPTLIDTNSILNLLYQKSSLLGVETKDHFLFLLGVIVFIVLISSLLFKALTVYAKHRFVQMREYSIARRLVEGYLNQPYDWFLSRHTADFGKNIFSEVVAIVNIGFKPAINLIAQGSIAIAILTLLMIVDLKLSLIIGLTFGAFYWILYKFNSKFLKKIGEERLKNNQTRFMAVSEAFSASKEVKFGGLESVYLKRFNKPAKIFAKNSASFLIVSEIPRFLLEIIAFGGMLFILLFLMSQSNATFLDALPTIALYTFAGYRLLPALQQTYSSIIQLRFINSSIVNLHNEINNLPNSEYKNLRKQNRAIIPKENITLSNIYYSYPNSTLTALKNMNIKIKVNTTVGIVGPTGSGKTTTVDILLGLLKPHKGTLKVDGKIIVEDDIHIWQSSIGYVPQNTFLADDTVAANIAFGYESKEINFNDIERAAKIANLHNFVENDLPLKYNSIVGERGVRLSGGQIQRIGIARALYKNPKFLILDEATSALDNFTEQAVMDAVNNLDNKITIVKIAHRLTTIKNCDKIFVIDRGELVAEGTYEDLLNKSAIFRRMANISYTINH
tara:strand:- start:3733 stop:5553 length:1821 start_codon:yes stop_codon:yes gene_type:complete